MPETLAVLDAYGKKHNISFIVVDTLGTSLGSANGMAIGGTNKIVIALDAEAGAILSVAGHEVFHYIKNQNSTDAQAIEDFVIDYLKNSEKYNYEERFKELSERYGTENEAEINEEIAANAMFQVLANEKTISELANENPTLLERIKNALKKFIEDIRNTINGLASAKNWKEVSALKDDLQALETIRAMFDAAMWKVDQANKNTAENSGGERYSIKYTVDNQPVVVIEENILENIPKSQWISHVKNIMMTFSDGIPVAGRLIKVNKKTRKEFVNSKNSQYYNKKNPVVYEDKFKTANSLDEIILASTNYINEDLLHSRKDSFKEFARGSVLVRIGNNDYSAKVIIGYTTADQMVLYDIIDFSPVEFVLKKESRSAFTAQLHNNAKSSSNTSADKRIPQNDSDVNSQYMQDSEENSSKLSLKSPSQQDINDIQAIGKKSVNAFSSSDIQKTEYWARAFYKQLGTKSPFFRAWFGDWRAYDTTPVKVATVQVNSGKVAKNADTGWDINVSGKVFNENKIHQSGVVRNASPYLPYINTIIENAVLLDSFSIGKKKSINSLFMHSFYAIADIGNGTELMKLYVEELNNPNSKDTIKRSYQLHNIEKKSAASGRVQANSPSSLTNTANIHTISDLFAVVNSKDPNFNPKSVNPDFLNKDGTPKIFYHGTSETWTEYDLTKNVNQMWGDGIYLTPYKERAALYGDNVMAFYVKADYDYKKAKAEGVKRDYTVMRSTGDVLVYSPNQIKSVTDNIGTFDSSKNDIRFSLKEHEDITEANRQLLRENEQLKTANKILREEFKRTNGHTLGTAGRNRAEIVANRLLRKYKSSVDKAATVKRIIDVFEYMSGNYASFNDARDAMTVIGEDIMRNLSAKEEYEHAGLLRELKKELYLFYVQN